MKATVLRQFPGLAVAFATYFGGILAGAFVAPASAQGFELSTQSVRISGVWTFLSNNVPLLALLAVGSLTCGLLTLLLLTFNGMLIGGLLASAHRSGDLLDGFAATLPHAPLEVAAVLLASAVGFVPVSVVSRLAVGRSIYSKTELKDAIVLLGTAMLLIVLASAVEAWITPLVITWRMGGM